MDTAKEQLIQKSFDKVSEIANGNKTKEAAGNFFLKSTIECLSYPDREDKKNCMDDAIEEGKGKFKLLMLVDNSYLLY